MVKLLNGRSLSVYSLFVYSLILKGCHCERSREPASGRVKQSLSNRQRPWMGSRTKDSSSFHHYWHVVARPSLDTILPVIAMSEVRTKHFRQDTANLKNLMLCNQKHRLFLYLLGKCFASTSVSRITREPDVVKGNGYRVETAPAGSYRDTVVVPIPSSQFQISPVASFGKNFPYPTSFFSNAKKQKKITY